MTARLNAESRTRAAVSCSSMCRLLKISRSQFYWHVKRGTFHAPLYLPSNKRPYYTASMVEDNLRARETGVGVNGEYVIFYERLPTVPRAEAKQPKGNHAALLDGLRATGLKDVTAEKIDAALVSCFPAGTSGQSEDAVLRAVYRHLKRSGAG